MIINSNTHTFIQNSNNKINSLSKESNKTEENKISDEEPVIQARNEYESESDKRRALHTAYYSKVNEENKKFANPYAHISDKYYLPSSPYYIEGLTRQERRIASGTEIQYLNLGASNINYGDPIFRGMGPLYGDVEVAKEKAYNRQAVNEQFQQLLDSNNITIPQNTKLRFTIDPNDYKVSVSGTEDLEMKKVLEELLDKENAKGLFYHIISSRSDDSMQYSHEKFSRFNLIREMQDITGYNLRDLDIIDGKFVTNDGTDIFEIYSKNVRDSDSIPEFSKKYMISSYGKDLYELAQNGFNSVPDLILSIDYENNSFYDVGQSENFGTGQTQWIEQLKASKTDEFIYV